MKKTISTFLALIFFVGVASAQDSTKTDISGPVLETGLLNVNVSDFESSENYTFFSMEAVSGYAMIGNSQLEVENLKRNRHGLVIHYGLSLTAVDSYIPNSTGGGQSFSSTTVGLNGGVGYGIRYNDVSGYGTVNTSIASYFDAGDSDIIESEFSLFSSNAAFLRLAGMWSPYKGKKSRIGIHSALNIALVEGGGTSFLIGLSLSPR